MEHKQQLDNIQRGDHGKILSTESQEMIRRNQFLLVGIPRNNNKLNSRHGMYGVVANQSHDMYRDSN